MRKKLFLISCASIAALVVLATQAYAATPILFQDKMITVDNVKTDIVISGVKSPKKLLVSGQDVGVRAFFEIFTDEVSWDNKSKIVTIKNKGEELVIPFSGNSFVSNDQIVLPEGWTYFKNGTAYLKFPYLAYVFDRYGEYESNSEESQWRDKLTFLGIQYIDTNNSAPKDHMVHSSVLIQN